MSEPLNLQVDHVEIYVPTRFEAADWYRRTLNLHIVEEYLEWASDPEGPLMIRPVAGGPMLALFRRESAHGRGRGTLQGLAFRTDASGFVAFLESVEANPVYNADGALTTEPRIADYESSISAYFFDPYGTPLEVTTYDPAPVRARLGMTPERVDL